MDKISSLRIASPLSFPFKMGAPGIKSPRGLTSPKSPTCAPISSNHHDSSSRVVRASATFSCNDTTSQEHKGREIVFRNENKNHYALLGVPCDASHDDIRIAYRRLALQYHPDVQPLHQLDSANNIFSEINGAYQTLSDPHKRKAYDEDLHLLPPKVYTARPATGFSSPTGSRRGRNWETDQCWC